MYGYGSWFIPTFGLNWEDIVAGGQGLFRDGFGSKTGVYRSCQGSSGTPLLGIHAVAWLGTSSGTPLRGIHAVAWLGATSGTPLRGIPRYGVAPAP